MRRSLSCLKSQKSNRFSVTLRTNGQGVNCLVDGERVFMFRALWFARGFEDPLPSFDQEIGFKAAESDKVSWRSHVDEFRAIRSATLALFRNLPEEAWLHSGIASDNPVTVRALAYIVAGHVSHHLAILRERYR
jgi:hypothetical protein